MDKLQYYRELEKEQQSLERNIQKQNIRIEELVQDIASLKEGLDLYRSSKEWLDNGQRKNDKFDPDIETRKVLSCKFGISGTTNVIQALKVKKSKLSLSTAKLSMELQK